MKKLGIDIGSLYAGLVLIEKGRITAFSYREHKGDVQGVLEELSTDRRFQDYDYWGITGTLAPAELKPVDTILSLAEGARFLVPESGNVFAVGGETFSLILFDDDGSYSEHTINPPCASGTGSFIEQQAERLKLSAAGLARRGAAYTGKTPVIATRCAVFAKTDIIHAMQEGYSVDAICAGLCEGIARSIADNLVKGREISEPAAVVGGVALNKKIVQTLEKILNVTVLVPQHAELTGAAGAAVLGTASGRISPESVKADLSSRQRRKELHADLPHYPDFSSISFENADGLEVMAGDENSVASGTLLLGIDIGSTSTKAVLMDTDYRIVYGFYTYTGGEPIAAVKRIMSSAEKRLPGFSTRLAAAGTTGSGRKIIKEVFSADTAVNEISAHARAAVHLEPEADTIIEIGGQDSKFTLLKDGDVYYSTMNYVCAAGTGSFIEEQAKRLQLSLSEFSDAALGSESPFTSDRCTVYMERDLSSLLAEGWSKKELSAAVLNSVRDNYLAKVVGKTALGRHIVFQGATARNKALVTAFRQEIDGEIYVSRYCHLTGAIGAGIIAAESAASQKSLFDSTVSESEIRTEVCDRCVNRCMLTVVERDGRLSGWGMKCGKDYAERSRKTDTESAMEKRFRSAMQPLLSASAPAAARLDAAASAQDRRDHAASAKGRPVLPVIGIPEVLYNADYAPLWHSFLNKLGFPTVKEHSPRRAMERGKGLINADFCAPIQLAHGSFAELKEAGADFLFYPAVVNEEDKRQEEHRFRRKTADTYYCYYSQYLPTITAKLTSIDIDDSLIAPLISFNSMDEDEIAEAIFEEMNKAVGGITAEDVGAAFHEARGQFNAARKALAGNFDSKNRTDERVRIAVLGRPYVALDTRANLGIPKKLEESGAEVYWQAEFDLEAFKPEYAQRYLERMHWHYGRKILALAEYAAQQENLFVVYLTCFRCSPDSFLLSYVKDIMNHYRKPFLFLQLDEHSSDVGYETRIEAGIGSFRNYLKRRRREAAETGGFRGPRNDALAAGDTVLIPCLDDLISNFWASCFRKAGFRAILLESSDEALSEGYRYVNGGECMPLVSLIGNAIEIVRREQLDVEKIFFYMPTVCIACNFPQFPVLADLAFTNAGLGGIKIGLINNMAPGEILPQSIALRMLESNIIGGILYKLYFRIQPYELQKGAAAAVLEKSKEMINSAIMKEDNLRAVLQSIVENFEAVERDESGGRKPRIGLLGDIYVKFNDVINQKIQKTVNDLGGELVVPSLTEYPFHFYDADVRLYGDNPRSFKLLRTIEKRYEKIAEHLIGDEAEPDFSDCVQLMEDYGIRHYLAGETSINVGRALYYITHGLVDALLHINPIFCCPGVVSSSLYRKIQEDFNIPIIDIFYDGTGQPNKILVPHLHYLNQKHTAGQRTAEKA
jgi:predicted CoA-substrate-specific enzyme activase